MKRILLLLVLVSVPFISVAQEADSTLEKQSPKVFIDCQWCDLDYIRTEINYVNYVYDRKNADIHIMITSQATGSGGAEYTLTYIGLGSFAAKQDTIVFTTNQDDTQDIVRSKMVKFLKIGLVPYIAQTPLIKNMTVSYNKPSGAMIKKDKWNNWVFRMSVNGWFNGEKSSRNHNIYGRISADRITEDWKIRLSLNTSTSENKYQYGDVWYKTTRKNKSFSGLVVRSLTDHWSFGASTDANQSSFMNIKASYSIAPAIEYNIFPYSESTRRELRILYKINAEYVRYYEETIYFKDEDNLFSESLSTSLNFKQPWGSVGINLSGSHYFHDSAKNRVSIFSSLSVRLFRGFSVNLYGGFSRIHDQLHLRAAGLSKEDVLLRRYALQTSYDYWGSIGIEYAFGSIFNNIVNSRFGGGGNRIIMMF